MPALTRAGQPLVGRVASYVVALSDCLADALASPVPISVCLPSVFGYFGIELLAVSTPPGSLLFRLMELRSRRQISRAVDSGISQAVQVLRELAEVIGCERYVRFSGWLVDMKFGKLRSSMLADYRTHAICERVSPEANSGLDSGESVGVLDGRKVVFVVPAVPQPLVLPACEKPNLGDLSGDHARVDKIESISAHKRTVLQPCGTGQYQRTLGGMETNAPAQDVIDELRSSPTISVDTYWQVMGISRSLAYSLIRDGSIPVIRLGRRLRIPSAAVLKMLEGEPT